MAEVAIVLRYKHWTADVKICWVTGRGKVKGTNIFIICKDPADCVAHLINQLETLVVSTDTPRWELVGRLSK